MANKIATIKTLEKATQLIYSLEESTKRNLYAVATTLQIVEKEKLYEEGDFKNTAEYAEHVHGYKRQTTQALIKVASRFLNGNVSLLKKEDEKDFTVYQLMELLPLTNEQVVDAVENGELTPYMTTKAIRELVKGYKAITAEEAKEDKEEAKAEPEEAKAEPEEAKAEPEEAKAEPKEAKAEPKEAKAEPKETDAEVMKNAIIEVVQNISSLARNTRGEEDLVKVDKALKNIEFMSERLINIILNH